MNEQETIKIIIPPEVEDYVRLQDIEYGHKGYTRFPEIKNIKKHLEKLNPKIALDVGCGIGRASIYFFRRFHWNDTLFIMADGDSIKDNIEDRGGIRDKKNEFYNSLEATKTFCKVNGIKKVEIFNLEKKKWSKLNCKPDIVYSFLSLGFHWPIWFHLDELYPRLEKGCLLLFGIRDDAHAKKWTCRQLQWIDRDRYRMIDLVLNASTTRESILVLEKL